MMTILFFASTVLTGNITKNSGEVLQLSAIEIYQEQGTKAEALVVTEFEQTKTIPLYELKRINIKQQVGRSKGVVSLLAILVERSNVKHEVVLDLVQITGLNPDGEEEVISANAINKITF